MRKSYLLLYKEALNSKRFIKEVLQEKGFSLPKAQDELAVKEAFSTLYYGWSVSRRKTRKQIIKWFVLGVVVGLVISIVFIEIKLNV